MKLWRIILINGLVTVIFLSIFALLAFAIVFIYRGPIFEHFASFYLEEMRGEYIGEDVDLSFVTLDHESRIIESVAKADPSVVSVVGIRSPSEERRSFFDEFLFDPFFRPDTETVSGGSGFIVSSEGHIVTNRHVVENDNVEYAVFTNDGRRHDVVVLDKDTFFDIAILKMNSEEDFKHLDLGDSGELRVGQTVIAIGNALGEFQNSVSVGVISGLSRSIVAGGVRGGTEFFDEVIQTDAAINPGNSGGPLMDIKGNVIGVNAAMALGSQNIGFAIPSNIVEPIVASVKETGRISRPFVGVRYLEITPFLQAHEDLPVDHGILLVGGGANDPAVMEGTPADEAGLREGDIIVEVDGEKLTERRSFAFKIRQKRVGDEMELTVIREGEKFSVSVELTEAP